MILEIRNYLELNNNQNAIYQNLEKKKAEISWIKNLTEVCVGGGRRWKDKKTKNPE